MKIQEKEIYVAEAASAPETVNVMNQVCSQALVKTEKALNLWLEDVNCKHVSIEGVTLWQKALTRYAQSKPSIKCGQSMKQFKASPGWFNNSRNCYSLKNVHIL